MGLLDQYAKFRDYIAANTPRSTRPVARPADVMREGLLNPNKFNAPAANRFKDSAFGLLGGVPGVGDAASAAEAADLFNRGEKVAGTFAALGALPLVPSFAGMVKQGGKAADALSYADEAAQNGGGLLKNADNAGMGKTNNQWATKDVFGDGRQIEHVSPDGRSAVVQQTLPSGKTVFYPADVDTQYGWVRPDMYKQFDTFEAAQNKIKGMRISDSAKKRNAELYGDIPNTWTGDAKKVAKKLIDSGIAVSRFSSSTQSKSKYIELADGRKIRMSDHDLPPSYEGSDFDFRYGGDIAELLKKLK